jgi:hypothetical protein
VIIVTRRPRLRAPKQRNGRSPALAICRRRAARDHYGASFATASSSWTISAGKNGQLPDFRMLGGTGRALKQASLRFGKQPAKAITAYLGHASIQRRSTSTVT